MDMLATNIVIPAKAEIQRFSEGSEGKKADSSVSRG